MTDQTITPYHAKYFAHALTLQGGKGLDRLSRSIFDACVDLNPHQIEAALFALRSPLVKGVLLADEVGLGKTIEAGLVLSQLWAERKRKLLVICPASIRKQWALELEEKFNLPSLILDAKSYRLLINEGIINPFECKQIVITSTHFASRHKEDLRALVWDMVVIDEAHKLRNAYRQSNKMGQNIRWALEDQRKILLTATPLQNSLLELYGLSTIIDHRIFGDRIAFGSMYLQQNSDLADLRERLKYFSHRTLRRQVLEYIQYTERHLITTPFNPTDEEHHLYSAVSDFLLKVDSYALPAKHRHLTSLIVRKLLASSSHALAGTLKTMNDRLKDIKLGINKDMDAIESDFLEDELLDEELLEELIEEDELVDEEINTPNKITYDIQKLESEIQELDSLFRWANGIGIDSKSRSLLKALDVGFSKMAEMNAAPKALIFTESRRTQRFLKDFLDMNGYVGKIVTFNGGNKEPETTKIYEKWLEKNADSGRISGSRDVNIRTAIIEHFRDHAQIMIATEAAAEGVNLQFCSLVINYDLPWNPQRIEQRIGRCHRYGQKYDVVVINFLNQRNEVDRRVQELLNEKFKLFSGVFGASDEVLGSIESGVDFEKRILDIYDHCRTPKEIEAAFKKLKSELDESISKKMQDTRKKLLENFDEEVHEHLKDNLIGTRDRLDQFSRLFWKLSQFELKNFATFSDLDYSFNLNKPPIELALPGKYHLISKEQPNITGSFLYRLSHPLGEYVLEKGKNEKVPFAKVAFDISNHETRISVIEALKGKNGTLNCHLLEIDSFEHEEYLLLSGYMENGQSLDQETLQKLFNCNGHILRYEPTERFDNKRLVEESNRHIAATIARSLEENNTHFNEARERLEKWADDLVIAAETALKQTKEQIKALNRLARLAENISEQHQLQEEIQKLEKKKRKQRLEIFEVEDEIAVKRDVLIGSLERRLSQKTEIKTLFEIEWKVV